MAFEFAREHTAQLGRTIEDAPQEMRRQLVDALYRAADAPIFDATRISVNDDLYPAISLMLGVQPVRVMHDAYAQRIGKNLGDTSWPMVFEVVVAMFQRLARFGRGDVFRDAVNAIFAMHGVAWDLGADGRLHRALPEGVQTQVAAMFAELADPRYDGARRLAQTAQAQYDARPRQDRDACSNIFDALEELAKVKLGMQGRGFGDVIAEMRRRNITPGLADVLDRLNGMAHQTFRHGNNIVIEPAVVDFIYLTCVGGILMFARLP